MGVFDNFPYVNIHDLNTDWLVKTVKAVKDKTDQIDQAVIDAQTRAAAAENISEQLSLLFVTPQMYGAVGDGVNDDTRAFTDAVNTGKSVYVPKGIYRLTSSIELNTDQALIGDTDKSSILDFINCDGIKGPNYADRSGTIIKNLFIRGNNFNTKGIIFNNTNDAIIDNVAVRDFEYGIYLNNSVNNTLNKIFCITNKTALYLTANSIYNKMFGSIITANENGLVIDTGSSLIGYAVDFEMSSVSDISGTGSVYVYNGHFEGHNTSPLSINIGNNMSLVLYNPYFISYTTAIKSTVNNGKLLMYDPILVDCTTHLDIPTFGYYHIERPTYLNSGGSEITPVNNISTLRGVIITDVYSSNGYTVEYNKFLKADKGSFTSLYKNGLEVVAIKASGRKTVTVGSVPANSTLNVAITDVNETLNAYTDFVIISPNSVHIPAGLMINAYVTPSQTHMITVHIANVTGTAVDGGSISFNYLVV